MPLYEYRCNECGEEFERMVRISETEKPLECPRCGSNQTSKQISQFASRLSAIRTASSGSSCAPTGSRFS